jgi:predicted RNA-binding protein
MNYWFCSTTGENHEISLSKNIWGVEKRYKEKLNQIKKGDKLIFYVKGRKLGGAFKVISNMYEDRNEIFNGGLFPFRIKIESVKSPKSSWLVEWTDEIIKNIDLIKNKDYRWKFELMGRTIKPLSEKDFNYLLSMIK